VRAGWSNYTFTGSAVNPAFPTLDRTTGFSVGVTLQLNSNHEHHVDQAGSRSSRSAATTSASNWHRPTTAAVGTKSSRRTKARPSRLASPAPRPISAALPNAATLTNYTLTIVGSTYTFASGSTMILTGALRDYSNEPGPDAPVANPYELNSYLFLGDDTTSANGSTTFSLVTVAVPEPGSMMIGFGGDFGAGGRDRRRTETASA
jgi:hypothetical protein